MDPSTFHTTVTLHESSDERPTLRFEHRYPHPQKRVWQAITSSAEHSAWFGFPVTVEPVVGGEFTVTFSEEMVERGKILEIDAPNLFVYTGREDVFRWRLSPDGDGCVVGLENEVGDPGHIPNSAAGFHLALDKLGDMLDRETGRTAEGAATPSFEELAEHYADTLHQSS